MAVSGEGAPEMQRQRNRVAAVASENSLCPPTQGRAKSPFDLWSKSSIFTIFRGDFRNVNNQVPRYLPYLKYRKIKSCTR